MKKNTITNSFLSVVILIAGVANAQQPATDTIPVTKDSVVANALQSAIDTIPVTKDSVVARQLTTDTIPVKRDSVIGLQGVVIQSSQPYLQQSAGKLVINVASSPVAAGGNAYDILVKTPGMTEQQDVFQFRGKSIQVLINNRPSNLTGEELKAMLQSTQAAGIEKIEILSSPSSAYDAQGGVVVNIRMAKNKNFGTNGVLTSSVGAGKYGRYAGGLSLNHRMKDLNIYGGYDWSRSEQYSRSSTSRLLDVNTFLSENEYAVLARNTHNYKLGVDYDINKTNSVGVLFRGMNAVRGKEADNLSLPARLDGRDDSSSLVNTRSSISISNPALNLYYRSGFDGKGRELLVNMDYFSYSKGWDDQFTTSFADANGKPYQPDYLLRNNSVADITVQAVSADYTHPLTKGVLKAGVKTTFTKTDNNADWMYLADDGWKNDAGKTNHFIYKENINAAYVNYSVSFKKFAVDGGLRVEQTLTRGISKTVAQDTRNNYLNLFPSVAVNYNASASNQFGLSFRRSITRFGFEVVNPFVSYISQYRYSQGNPLLRPTFSNSVEFSHTYKSKLISSLNYSHFTDVLTPVFKKATGSDAVISTQENLSSASQVSLSVTYMQMLLKNKWTMNNTIGTLYAQMNDNSGAGAGSKTGGAYVSSMNMFAIRNGWNAELSAMYMSSLTIGVLHVKGQGSVNLGVSKAILKKMGKLTLNVTDIFNTQQQRYTVSSFGVSSTNLAKAETRAIRLAFSWKFGNKNVKAGKVRPTGIEDVKKRTEL